MDISTLTKEDLFTMVMELTQENVYLRCKASTDPENNPLFSDYILTWLENLRYQWQPTTYDSYHNIIHNHIAPYFRTKNITIKNIKPSTIEAYYSYKLSEGLSSNTIRRHHANIRKCLRSALKDELIKSNPALLVDLPQQSKSLIDYYSKEDLIILLKHARTTIIYPVILLTSLGLRRSEAIGMMWNNIDLEHNTINITQKVVAIKGNPVHIQNVLKTKSSHRVLQIPDYIASELKYIYDRHVREYQNNLESYRKGYLDYVCLDRQGNLISPVRASEFLSKNLIHKFDLKPITLKGLRHTCATLISELGFNLKYIQEWLGHSTITLTGNTYTHVNMKEKEKVAAAMH